MKTVYDAGVLIAADRNDRSVWAEHRALLEYGFVPSSTAPVVAQVSRSGRQVQLRRFLRGCEVLPFVPDQAHDVGRLLAATGTTDVVDGHLVLAAESVKAARIITSDPVDISRLTVHLRRPLRIDPVS